MKKIIFLIILLSFSSFPQSIEQRIDSILAQMTTAEKILQLHKEGGMNTQDNTRLNIPGFIMADGPHGVREGMATSFPVGIAMAATWDTALAWRVGLAMGKEFRAKGKHQMLGPAMDMTRDPRNGRTPESGGEDPVLNAYINAAALKGVQSTAAFATAKHYNGKHRQANRTNNNYTISQRQLLEHYGLNFRKSVQDAGALSVMSAYNSVNGHQAAESYSLLTDILRTQWGFPFYVVSDWGGVKNSGKALKAGNDICMGSDHYQNDLMNLLNSNAISINDINKAVRNVLRTKIIAGMTEYIPNGVAADLNSTAHQQLCLEAGMKGIVLLKNSGNILPLDKTMVQSVAVIGPNANVLPLDGTGSSWVTPFYSVSPRQGIENMIGVSKVLYAEGCTIGGGFSSDYQDALTKAGQAEIVIYVGGLDQSQEGEGLDRANGSIELPGNQKQMIQQLAAVNPNLIVVLISGGITGVSGYINNVKGLLQAFYPGQEGGNAIAKVLFGEYNPSGKLPVTIPVSDAQLGPLITDFDFTNDFGCGYRWFDNNSFTPQFAFGYGLSYTSFAFSGITFENSSVSNGKNVTAYITVSNLGSRAGTETVQFYLSKEQSAVYRDKKSLIGFEKVYLEPGASKTVTFTITPEMLYYYDDQSLKYRVEEGVYTLKAGNSSDNLPEQNNFTVTASQLLPDLQIANIYTVPRYPLPGDKVQFAATVVNRGTGETPAGTAVKVHFKVNGTVISKSISFINSLKTGGMVFLNGDTPEGASIFWNAETVGENTVEAQVNYDGSMSETYTNNNTAAAVFKVYPVPPQNLAQRKSIYVTSIEGPGLEGYRMVDGNYGTRWSSAFADPQQLVINFGAQTEFNMIRLVWENAFGKEYYIQSSNDSLNWTNLFYRNNGQGGVEEIPVTGSGKYLRMLLIRRGTEWGYSLYELEVFKLTGADEGALPDDREQKEFNLLGNYPNPFNPSTNITFMLSRQSGVSLRIYDTLGRELLSERYENLEAGRHEKRVDLSAHPSGIYFYTVSAKDETGSSAVLGSKMVFLK